MKEKEIEKKKKVPFNVLRKPFAAAMVGVTMLAGSVGLLTGCSGEQGAKGDKGDTGSTGKSAYELAVENGFEGTVQEWLESLSVKGDTGNGIENIDVEYEYDKDGNLYAVFTITYTESEAPEIIKVLMPAKVEYISGLTYNRIAKLPAGKSMPLTIGVSYDNDKYENIAISEDMISNIWFAPVEGGYEEVDELDLTKAGTYDFDIYYMGQYTHSSLEVVNLLELGTIRTYYQHEYQFNINKFASLDDILVTAAFEDGLIENVTLPVSMVVDSFETIDQEPVEEIDFTKAGRYYLNIAEDFMPSDESDSFYITLYNPEVCNISSIFVDDFVVEHNDANFIDSIVGTEAEVWFFEDVDGESHTEITITEDMIDASAVDITKIGSFPITISYTLEGQETYTEYAFVDVQADMTNAGEPTATYTVDASLQEMIGETVAIYENGVAVSEYGQRSYDKTQIANNIFKYYDSMMGGDLYLAIEDGVIVPYIPTTPVAKTYTAQKEVMGDIYNVKIEVFGSTGTCKALITIVMGPYEMPYGVTDVTFVDETTLEAFGDTWVVGENLTEVTPQA